METHDKFFMGFISIYSWFMLAGALGLAWVGVFSLVMFLVGEAILARESRARWRGASMTRKRTLLDGGVAFHMTYSFVFAALGALGFFTALALGLAFGNAGAGFLFLLVLVKFEKRHAMALLREDIEHARARLSSMEDELRELEVLA